MKYIILSEIEASMVLSMTAYDSYYCWDWGYYGALNREKNKNLWCLFIRKPNFDNFKKNLNELASCIYVRQRRR